MKKKNEIARRLRKASYFELIKKEISQFPDEEKMMKKGQAFLKRLCLQFY